MSQSETDDKNIPADADPNNAVSDIDNALELDEVEVETLQDEQKDSSKKLHVIEEISDLLSKDNILIVVDNYKADSEEKEIAIEFAISHVLFIEQIVINDNEKGIIRTDVEIRDLVAHTNILLKNENEYIFTAMVVHSPSHYKNIRENMLKKKDSEEKSIDS